MLHLCRVWPKQNQVDCRHSCRYHQIFIYVGCNQMLHLCRVWPKQNLVDCRHSCRYHQIFIYVGCNQMLHLCRVWPKQNRVDCRHSCRYHQIFIARQFPYCVVHDKRIELCRMIQMHNEWFSSCQNEFFQYFWDCTWIRDRPIIGWLCELQIMLFQQWCDLILLVWRWKYTLFEGQVSQWSNILTEDIRKECYQWGWYDICGWKFESQLGSVEQKFDIPAILAAIVALILLILWMKKFPIALQNSVDPLIDCEDDGGCKSLLTAFHNVRLLSESASASISLECFTRREFMFATLQDLQFASLFSVVLFFNQRRSRHLRVCFASIMESQQRFFDEYLFLYVHSAIKSLRIFVTSASIWSMKSFCERAALTQLCFEITQI